MAMLQVPRVTSYRGFIFVSQAADGPSLEESLGHMTTSIDDMVDRAPDGEIEVAGGVFKHTYNGNWKLYLENLCDAAHRGSRIARRSTPRSNRATSVFRRRRRDRDPADAPEWRALQLLGNRRSGSGPIRTATAISAIITTTRSSSPR